MNELVKRFLLEGGKLMLEMHFRQPVLHTVLVDHLQKINKEYKNLKKQETHGIFIKSS